MNAPVNLAQIAHNQGMQKMRCIYHEHLLYILFAKREKDFNH